jgi:hypothetical protein
MARRRQPRRGEVGGGGCGCRGGCRPARRTSDRCRRRTRRRRRQPATGRGASARRRQRGRRPGSWSPRRGGRSAVGGARPGRGPLSLSTRSPQRKPSASEIRSPVQRSNNTNNRAGWVNLVQQRRELRRGERLGPLPRRPAATDPHAAEVDVDDVKFVCLGEHRLQRREQRADRRRHQMGRAVDGMARRCRSQVVDVVLDVAAAQFAESAPAEVRDRLRADRSGVSLAGRRRQAVAGASLVLGQPALGVVLEALAAGRDGPGDAAVDARDAGGNKAAVRRGPQLGGHAVPDGRAHPAP